MNEDLAPPAEGSSSASPPPPTTADDLLKNPLALAVGGLIAGMLITRFIQRDSIRRATEKFADEIARNTPTDGGMASSILKTLTGNDSTNLEDKLKKMLADYLSSRV